MDETRNLIDTFLICDEEYCWTWNIKGAGGISCHYVKGMDYERDDRGKGERSQGRKEGKNDRKKTGDDQKCKEKT